MYKKVDGFFVLDFLLSKITHNISEKGEGKCKNPKKRKKEDNKKKLGFNISHFTLFD